VAALVAVGQREALAEVAAVVVEVAAVAVAVADFAAAAAAAVAVAGTEGEKGGQMCWAGWDLHCQDSNLDDYALRQ
jgi:hypothetical protein